VPNPRLTPEQLALANDLLKLIRQRLDELSRDDRESRFAFNRKVAKELLYDERSRPADRHRLKRQKRKEQAGKCAKCSEELPARGAVLDRLVAIDLYTPQNTQLICERCDKQIQADRGYR
jgi:5-methylcytosine-specific restriction endonuclease McrA